MIAKLKGIVDSITDDAAVIDVHGVGYLVFCSGRTLRRLVVGEPAALVIETHVREDHIHLYGFVDVLEREWFKLLTTVQGVGARVGLAILSVVPPETVGQAIAAQDKAPLTRCRWCRAKAGGAYRIRIKRQSGQRWGRLPCGRDQRHGDTIAGLPRTHRGQRRHHRN